MQPFGSDRIAAAICAIAIMAPIAVQAQTPGSQTGATHRAEMNAAWEAGEKAGTRGPADITLIDQAVLKLPARYFFIPKAEGMRIMRALGNLVSEASFVGLVVGTQPGDRWVVVARYIKEGYIKDDDAKNWNADELLQNIKDGTAEANKDRVARGFGELVVLGWVEKPAYDATTHRLVWSLLSKEKGEADTAARGINYNTYALGRDGYFSLNLLTDSNRISADKGAAHELLTALAYNAGKRYEDFNASTDHIAEYGLAALIGGVAAKKLGLFALGAALFAKFAKLIFIGIAAVGASLFSLFRRRSRSGSPDA